ncbi:MAG TPA: cyclopropane-fatty-acyl-phospholipid synthase family protein [Planctomycetota bacterium]|nr:cyclopropane-fatty-acyl-phospholipid synthase family protein [Planctomycetota bacterium]
MVAAPDPGGESVTGRVERWLAAGRVPDWLVRRGIRRLLGKRLAQEHASDPELSARRLQQWIARCDRSEIAVETQAANTQHYEVPAAFYAHVLGRHRKYSSGLWTRASTLDDAEADMLALTCERAGIEDGMRVLDLGCGWGSLTLWLAQHWPNCRVVGVSNAASQQLDVLARAEAAGLRNVEVVTADANTFTAPGRFDRIVSVEMMEHTRNWRRLLERAASWLVPAGRMFVHVFTHRSVGYEFATDGRDDWMARHFFTGGQMPADAQLLWFQDHFAVQSHWRVPGWHYARTAEAWLANFDRERTALAPILRAAYGERAAAMGNLWRVFFMACAELWGCRGGSEWLVSHYLLQRR